MDRVEERHLLQRAQRGDADAFAQLYRAHVQPIFRYIYYRVNDTQLAEDLTSAVFTRALQALGSYTDQGKPFIAWLYRIAHARVVDHYRRVERRPVESDVEAEPIPVLHDMDHRLLRRQAATALREAIIQLTGEQQHVIILRFMEGYNLEDTAMLMGKNANAIKALQHRALRSLARHLAQSGFDSESILAGLS
ncbi:MAG: sigma-70 family RNA polymerase sigma factor [Anaerolineaceae bacterium]|nr:sigma-70 family RNA polymerase sigma factor [Anaerolineaceae bacterium]